MNTSYGSTEISNIEGDVSGVITDSIGSIAARVFNNYGTLVINNPRKDLQTLTKIQNIPTEHGAIQKGNVRRDEFNALLQGVNKILGLLEKNQAQTMKAGNIQISHSELSLNEILLKGNEYCYNGMVQIGLDYFDRVIRKDPNYIVVWDNKGNAFGLLEYRDHRLGLKC